MIEYDRVLIAEMLEEYARHHMCDMDLCHLEESILEQAKMLREADDLEGADTVSEPCPHVTDLAA